MRAVNGGYWARLSLATVLVLSASSGTLWAKKTVDKIRYYVHEDRTRVVIDLGGDCSYEALGAHKPERIAINLRGAKAGRALRGVKVGRGGVDRVRINKLSWGVQVVVDLDSRIDWKHFALARNKTKPNRIVVDVLPVARSRPVASREPMRERTASGSPNRPVIVAVDAGHGGRDRGTKGNGLTEKPLTLDIAKRVAREINKEPGFKAVLTRSTDVYLSLERRTGIAKHKGADAFVSIHLNQAPRSSARGSEVFFVTPHGAARSASQKLSNPKRAANEYGIDGSASNDILHMLVDMNEQAVLEQSEALAASILGAMRQKGLPPTRAVKQRSFQILRTIEMPSVLVEAGFLSNRHDANVIRKQAGRDHVARAITKGVVRYFRANPPVRAESDMYVVHKVERGDTLWKISRRYNTSVTSIRRANNLGNTSVLRVGQELLVSRGY